jgi:kumamolisin
MAHVDDLPEGFRRLRGSERAASAGAQRVGDEAPDRPVTVTVLVRRRPDGPPPPGDTEFSVASSRASGRTPRQDFAQLYGAHPDDLAAVESYARSQGLQVEATNPARRTVVVSGTVAQMNGAFSVNLGRYESADGTYRGREGQIAVPADLADVIEGVFGLDDRDISRTSAPIPNPSTTVPLTPPRVARLYQFPTNSAAGQTIGILSFGGGYRLTDITPFYNDLGPGFVTPKITDVLIDAAANSPAAVGTALAQRRAETENILDICVAGSVAQGADLAVYFSANSQRGWVDALTRAIHPDPGDPEPSVLSISWYFASGDDNAGLVAGGVSPALVDAVHACLHDAAIVGVTVVGISGDNGSSNLIDSQAHAMPPGSSPFALAVGGTTIDSVTASGGFNEFTWNDTSFGVPTTGGLPAPAATGGGVSAHFDVPTWQLGAGIPPSINDPTRRGRGVPDIAGNASANSGYRLYVDGVKQGAFGGTSAAAPLYAGLIATINAALLDPVGYLNPTLYALGGQVFHDINDGRDNSITFINGTGATVTSPGYRSGPGWDACTGLGRVNGSLLLSSLHRLLGDPQDHVVLADSSDAGPALVSHGGRLFLAWRGSGNTQLNMGVSDDNGRTFSTSVLSDSSDLGPALTSHNGQLMMAWVGRGNEDLNVATVDLPAGPGPITLDNVARVTLPETSDAAPALASHGGRLYLAWKGSGNPQLNIEVSDDGGRTFGRKMVFGDTTQHGPALVSHEGQLILAWTGEGAHNLDVATVSLPPDGSIGLFSHHTVVSDARSGDGPALASHDGRLFLAWQGPNEPRLNVEVSTDSGANFHGKQIFSDTTEHSPALASHNGRLFLAWPGEGAHHLNVEKLTPAPFTEDPLEHIRALMDYAGALLDASQSGSGTDRDALHDLEVALATLNGLAPPPFLQYQYDLLLMRVLRALVVALLGGAASPPEILNVIHEALAVAERAATDSGGDLLAVVPFTEWFAGVLVTVGVPQESVAAQQRVVDLLVAFSPAEADRQLGRGIALAQARENLIVRLISAGRKADALALVPQTITSYRDYAALPGADAVTVARDLFALDKQIGPDPSSLPVDIERAAVDVTTTVLPLPGHEAEYRLAKAESLHNLMIRLLENGQSAEAADLPPRILAAYQQAAASAGVDVTQLRADLTDLVSQLKTAGFAAESTSAQQLLDDLPIGHS